MELKFQNFQKQLLSGNQKLLKKALEDILEALVQNAAESSTIKAEITFKYKEESYVIKYEIKNDLLYNNLISYKGLTLQDAQLKFTNLTTITNAFANKGIKEIITQTKKSNLVKKWKLEKGGNNPEIIGYPLNIRWNTPLSNI